MCPKCKSVYEVSFSSGGMILGANVASKYGSLQPEAYFLEGRESVPLTAEDVQALLNDRSLGTSDRLRRGNGQAFLSVGEFPEFVGAGKAIPDADSRAPGETGAVSLAAREGAIKSKLASIRSRFSVLERAYLCSNLGAGAEEIAEIEKMLSDILSEGHVGLLFLLERLSSGVTISGNSISLHNWGEDTWNELLKKQAVIQALGVAKATGALSELEKLHNASCNYGQWHGCIRGPLGRTIRALKQEEVGEPRFRVASNAKTPSDVLRTIDLRRGRRRDRIVLSCMIGFFALAFLAGIVLVLSHVMQGAFSDPRSLK
jgi:hypothetical protein